MFELTTGVIFLMSSLYGSGQSDINPAVVIADSGTEQATSTEFRSFTDSKNIESYLREEYSDTPILVEIARCESEFRQYASDGTVLRGRVVRDDIGVMQINEHYHGDTAEAMGIDIHTVEGNVAYAKYLYDEYGTDPWSASKPCWSKPANIAKK